MYQLLSRAFLPSDFRFFLSVTRYAPRGEPKEKRNCAEGHRPLVRITELVKSQSHLLCVRLARRPSFPAYFFTIALSRGTDPAAKGIFFSLRIHAFVLSQENSLCRNLALVQRCPVRD